VLQCGLVTIARHVCGSVVFRYSPRSTL
jgi:hypothetical protein